MEKADLLKLIEGSKDAILQAGRDDPETPEGFEDGVLALYATLITQVRDGAQSPE